jgi:hypothetical protein
MTGRPPRRATRGGCSGRTSSLPPCASAFPRRRHRQRLHGHVVALPAVGVGSRSLPARGAQDTAAAEQPPRPPSGRWASSSRAREPEQPARAVHRSGHAAPSGTGRFGLSTARARARVAGHRGGLPTGAVGSTRDITPSRLTLVHAAPSDATRRCGSAQHAYAGPRPRATSRGGPDDARELRAVGGLDDSSGVLGSPARAAAHARRSALRAPDRSRHPPGRAIALAQRSRRPQGGETPPAGQAAGPARRRSRAPELGAPRRRSQRLPRHPLGQRPRSRLPEGRWPRRAPVSAHCDGVAAQLAGDRRRPSGQGPGSPRASGQRDGAPRPPGRVEPA